MGSASTAARVAGAVCAVALALAGSAPAAAAQSGSDDPARSQPRPRALFKPRLRAGWLPFECDLRNDGDARATLHFDLRDPTNDNSLRFRHVLELEPGAQRRVIGYLWGVADDRQWGRATEPCRNAQVQASDGTYSPVFDLAQVHEDGWQLAVIGPRGLTWGVPKGIRLSPGDVRPGVPAGARATGFRRVPAVKPGTVQEALRLEQFVEQFRYPLAAHLLRAETVPDHLVGWDPIDAVWLTAGPHLDRLTPTARGALLQWAAMGGIVIVGAGEEAKSLDHVLIRELCGTFATTPRTGPAEPAAELDPDLRSDPMAVAMGSATDAYRPGLPPGAAPLVQWRGDVMLSARRFGRGWVFYSALDLTRTSDRADPAPRGPPDEAVAACLQYARRRQGLAPRALGHRRPGLPAGEMPADEMAWSVFGGRSRFGNGLVDNSWYSADRSAMAKLVSGIHTGRDRMPSPWSVMLFLALYLLALGPGVWWLRRTRGGGLIGIPLTIGAALLFSLGAIVFGLATRGVGLVTQRVTVLWPVPGRSIAGEQTALSLFAGIARNVDVTFPGQVAPLPVDADGTVGGGSTLTVRLAPDRAEAIGVGIGSWSTRVLLAEGARAIGGPIAATVDPSAYAGAEGVRAGALVTLRNDSSMPLEAGVLWTMRGHGEAWVEVPPLAPGTRHAVAVPERRFDGGESVEQRLGLRVPDDWGRRHNVLSLVIGPDNGQVDRLGQTHPSPLRRHAIYLARVAPVNLPGGGPIVDGTSLRDDVLVAVPVEARR